MNDFDPNTQLAPQQESSGAPEFAFKKNKSKISAQTMVLVGVLVIGSGLLFAMRKLGMGPGMSHAGLKIEYEPGSVTTTAAEVDRLLSSLDRLDNPVQIPGHLVTRNPFAMEHEPQAQTDVPVDTGPRPEDLDRRARQQLIEATYRGLNVQSIMGGRVPLAKINGETVMIGDTIEDVFRVQAIQGRSVVLWADGQEYTLELGGSNVGGRSYR